MKNLKKIVVGLSLLSFAGPAFAATKEEELSAAKATYTASVTTIKTNYTAQIDPLTAQISDLTTQKKTYSDTKKGLADSRKTSRATIQADFKSRRQTECRDPKTATKEAAKTVYYAAKADCSTNYPKITDATTGDLVTNPDYTTCVSTAQATRDAAYTEAATTYGSCINNLNTEKQTAYLDLDSTLGWTSAVTSIADLNAQIAPLREQKGALKDAMSAELEPLKTAYDEAVAAIEAKYAACVDSSWAPSTDTYYTNQTFTQTSNCGTTKTVSGTKAIEAVKYVIVSSDDDGGTIRPWGSYEAVAGSSVSYTITPNEGYQIRSVMVDENNMGATTSFTFDNVQAAHTIMASFEPMPAAVTVSEKTIYTEPTPVTCDTRYVSNWESDLGLLPCVGVTSCSDGSTSVKQADPSMCGL